ncbi:MAG: phosphoribosylformylglycinamidine synthase [Candidatus Aenigmarchaeota archaeon]|nr:phosphoribosylformylglycinamidine synthase [Candidatus Aenigmarchaeota archaeon]
MPARIEVGTKEGYTDTAGRRLLRRARAELGINASDIRVVSAFSIDGDVNAEILASELFADPITEIASTSAPLGSADWALEVGFRPGVTDNPGRTASDAVGILGYGNHEVHTSHVYLISGTSEEDARRIVEELVSNSVINSTSIGTGKNRRFEPYLPRVRLTSNPEVKKINLNVSDGELVRISKELELALNLEEMQEISEKYETISDAGLQTIAAAWSDHCVHKRMGALVTYKENGREEVIDSLYRTLIKNPTKDIRQQLGKEDWLVSVFVDNGGVLKLGNGYNLAIKVETHNFPSFLDGFSGANTGIGGVLRDPHETGLGHRILATTDVFCFADPRYEGSLPERAKHPRRTFEDVRRGVEDYGNKFGSPTVNGAIRFDSYPFGTLVDRTGAVLSYFRPLVFCGAVGIAPEVLQDGRPSHVKKANPGDVIILAGGKTGADGIHGATASSTAVDKYSPATAVQIGDPYTEKNLFDMVLEARDLGLYTSITDNGAAGLACSVGEMARESGGAYLELEKVPLKYTGLQPWEILLSEAQERITVAVPEENAERFLSLAAKRGVEATVVGRYTDSGRFRTTYRGEPVSDADLEFLNSGYPRKKLEGVWEQPVFEEPEFDQPEIGWALANLLATPNIASKEAVIRQYDHEVQASTVVKPLTGAKNDGPSDAAVIWPNEMQRTGSMRGFAVAAGINANYGLIDPYNMAALNIDEAIRNAVASGADPSRIVLLDNFCWSSPEHPYRVAQLVRASKAARDFALAFRTPFVSGKDSMSNDYHGKLEGNPIHIAVPPTLLVTSLGWVPDISQSITSDAKTPGNRVYLIGTTSEETGGSEYYAMMGYQKGKAFVGNRVPKVNAERALKTYKRLFTAIQAGAVASCHDCSDGGLGVAAAEMAFAGGYGMDLNVDKVRASGRLRPDILLFGESASRLFVEVPEAYAAGFEDTMRGVPYAHIGQITNSDYLSINGMGINTRMHLADLKEAWQRTLQ